MNDPLNPNHVWVWDATAGAWVDGGPIQGIQGVQGPQGVAGPQGPAGPTAVSTDANNISKLGTDGKIFTPATDVTGFLKKTGDTMTGQLGLTGSGTTPLRIGSDAANYNLTMLPNQEGMVWQFNATPLLTVTKENVQSRKPLMLEADPTVDLEAATKKYVDAKFAGGGYVLPIATDKALGGVMIGTGLAITAAGVLSAAATPLTPATATVLGGIKVGAGLAVTADGTLSSAAAYTLPIATDTVLGGVKVGSGLAVTADGTLSALGGTYTLPIATDTVLGGIKVGAPAAGKYVSGVGADGTLIYATPSATGSPLRLPPTEVSSFNGTDAYLYYDTVGNARLQMASGRNGFRVENATGDFFLSYKLAVTGQSTFSSTVNLPGTGTASSATFGATTYNLTVGSGGIAWRNNTTNIQLIAAASITNLVPMITPATGNGVVFGSGGAALNRGSTATKIAATGMIELPTTAPAAGEAVPRSYVDGRVVVTAVGATAPSTTGLQDGAMWVEAA